ncbi:MAG TPA: glycoside hydrolase family 76 protein [Candidatus Acidoferrum sp.]|jgi:predicted alpha-1,6-mannanase (GH76 family)|nr:glycoside hydrolase family 76 protein [Candidatus Acidoferrum sp.]
MKNQYPRLRALCFLFWALLLLPSLPDYAQTGATYHNRADQALQSFLLKFWNGGSQYLRNTSPSDGSLTGYWTYAHGWDAVMDGVERTGGQQYAGWIESLYLGQNQRGWTNNYYDDECWMATTLTRAYDLTGNSKYLNQATALYADIMTGWDTTCCGAAPGGMWWDKTRTQKATAANAGAALLGARLYLRTGNSLYLSFAQQVYGYWYTNMVNPSTYQVCDHLLTDGTKVWWKFTYNEGLMIGASVALNQATGDLTYLGRANSIANFMINNEVASTTNGPVLYDGDNSGCGGDCHEFKGPGYRYLMQLFARNTTQGQYLYVLRSSANSIWNMALNPTSTVFSVNWAGPWQTNADQAQDNAACIALSRFAQQNGLYPGSGVPSNQYEAENATLHNLGVEALYGAFTGWGYIAGWNANGTSVDFNVNIATGGVYALSLRYAAGAGNASRLISINGFNAFVNLSFANTGAWNSYSTNTVTANLPAGQNTITVAFNSTYGSANWLNLDNLTLIPIQILLASPTVSPAGTVHLTWTATPGVSYRPQYRNTLGTGTWTDLTAPVVATGPNASADDLSSLGAARYYRVVTP